MELAEAGEELLAYILKGIHGKTSMIGNCSSFLLLLLVDLFKRLDREQSTGSNLLTQLKKLISVFKNCERE